MLFKDRQSQARRRLLSAIFTDTGAPYGDRQVECIPVVAVAPAVSAIPPSRAVRAGKVDGTGFQIWLDINVMVDCPSGWQLV